MTKSQFVWGFIAALFVLRHDWWAWSDDTLWLGSLPTGLFYQVLISLGAGLAWALVMKHCWPGWLEQWANTAARQDDTSPPFAP